jgi:hypothetical protein
MKIDLSYIKYKKEKRTKAETEKERRILIKLLGLHLYY